MPKALKTLTDKQKQYIDNYSNDITHIEGTINQVRCRPTMYLGAMNEQGLLTMFREIFQNAVDQLVSDKSPCNNISVLYDERDYKFIISDDGMGIPEDWLIQIYTEGHTGKNLAKNKLGDYSAGTNGIGAKAVNAVSEYFDVVTYNYSGTCNHIHFKKGKLTKQEKLPNKDHLQGTTVEFVPDHTILGTTPLEPAVVYTLVRDIISLLPIGSHISYTSINKKGKTYHEEMINQDGIISNLLGKASSMLITPIIVEQDTGRMKLECAFTFDQQDIGGEDITAYANMCPTSNVPLNSHVTGVLDGITSWFVSYMNKIFLTDREKSKIKINSSDVKQGLKLMISAWHLEPQFTGQAKEIFSNQDYKPFAKDIVIEGLDSWAKDRPNDLLKVCKFLKDIAQARIKADTEKVKITAKYAVSATSGLPAKYTKPISKNPAEVELFIVEGDSAGGQAKSARNPQTQGIFPIRGKILNVFQANNAKILANNEVMGIVQILGAGYGKNFDINKLKIGKLIFMTDADSDGSHISDLLLLMCLKMFPGLVESGRVYKAVPPLYGIPLGKKRMAYFADRVDFIKYMQKEFYKKNVVTDMKGKPIDSTTFSRLLIENSDYIYDFSTIMERRKINSILLEMIISSYLKKERFETLRKRITSEFRFMENENITKIGDTIKIKGLVNGRIETIFVDDIFIKEECESIIEPIRKAMEENHLLFKVNGQKVGLYDLMSMASNLVNTVSRFKGLGEMDYDQLAESTMNPDTRTLIQYTVNDIDETMRIIRDYDSHKSKILLRIRDSVERDDLIGL